MRIFIVHNGNDIISVSKVEVMSNDQQHPYGQFGDHEKIFEIPENLVAQFEHLDVLEIHNNYQIAEKGKKVSLEKKK